MDVRRPVKTCAAGGLFSVIDTSNNVYTWSSKDFHDVASIKPSRVDFFDGLPRVCGRPSDDSAGVCVDVAIGEQDVAFLLETGEVYCTRPSDESSGEPGQSLTDLSQNTFLRSHAARSSSVYLVDSLPSDIAQIVAGGKHFVVRTHGGDIWVWGSQCVVSPMKDGPMPSLGPPCCSHSSHATTAATAEKVKGGDRPHILGSLGSSQGWGLRAESCPTKVDLTGIARACGIVGGTFHAIGLAAGSVSTIIMIMRGS